MKKARDLLKPILRERKPDLSLLNSLVFCEKATGVAQFRGTEAGVESTVDRVASLLAMQCLVRGSEPTDFAILVPADKQLVDQVTSRAKKLLDEGRAAAGPSCLSPRQREILHAVLGNRSNKEIASNLNISVRTVKFHVSSLLDKFGVENRGELARRAISFLKPAALTGPRVAEERPVFTGNRELRVAPANRTMLPSRENERRTTLPHRFLSA